MKNPRDSPVESSGNSDFLSQAFLDELKIPAADMNGFAINMVRLDFNKRFRHQPEILNHILSNSSWRENGCKNHAHIQPYFLGAPKDFYASFGPRDSRFDPASEVVTHRRDGNLQTDLVWVLGK